MYNENMMNLKVLAFQLSTESDISEKVDLLHRIFDSIDCMDNLLHESQEDFLTLHHEYCKLAKIENHFDQQEEEEEELSFDFVDPGDEEIYI